MKCHMGFDYFSHLNRIEKEWTVLGFSSVGVGKWKTDVQNYTFICTCSHNDESGNYLTFWNVPTIIKGTHFQFHDYGRKGFSWLICVDSGFFFTSEGCTHVATFSKDVPVHEYMHCWWEQDTLSPTIMVQWKSTPNEKILLLEGSIFHFDDHGRKGRPSRVL